jgi:hypothetical protein
MLRTSTIPLISSLKKIKWQNSIAKIITENMTAEDSTFII